MLKIKLLRDKIKEREKSEDKPRITKEIHETIDHVRDRVNKAMTTDISTSAMNDIELLKGLDNLSELEVKMYADKYKLNPMILKMIKQIAKPKGYNIEIPTIESINDLLDGLGVKVEEYKKVADLLKYLDQAEQDILSLLEGKEITVTKKVI